MIFLRIGNAIVSSEQSGTVGEDCAPRANSEMTLKEKIAKLDDMEFIHEKESESD